MLERGEELDEFVSGPKELLIKLVSEFLPIPALGDDEANAELQELLEMGDGEYEGKVSKVDLLY